MSINLVYITCMARTRVAGSTAQLINIHRSKSNLSHGPTRFFLLSLALAWEVPIYQMVRLLGCFSLSATPFWTFWGIYPERWKVCVPFFLFTWRDGYIPCRKSDPISPRPVGFSSRDCEQYRSLAWPRRAIIYVHERMFYGTIFPKPTQLGRDILKQLSSMAADDT